MSVRGVSKPFQVIVVLLVVVTFAAGVYYVSQSNKRHQTETTDTQEAGTSENEEIPPNAEETQEEEHQETNDETQGETTEPPETMDETSGADRETQATAEEEPSDVRVERLTLSKETAYVGEPVEAWVFIRNHGETERLYTLQVTVSGELVASTEVPLGPGETQELPATFTRYAIGNFTVQAGGMNETLRVHLADLEIDDLTIYPETVSPGEAANVTAKVFNPNLIGVNTSVRFIVGGEATDVDISLPPYHWGTVWVETTINEVGNYSVHVGNLTGFLIVAEPGDDTPFQPPDEDDGEWPEAWVWYEPDPLTDGFTSLLPPEASPVRLSLPSSIEDIFFEWDAGLAGYGMHAGGHVEGLNHVWIEVRAGVPIRSWGDGVVTEIRESGGSHAEVHMVIIDYGQGLEGTHMDIKTPFVEVGDNVSRGDPVGEGMSFISGRQSAEFRLMDKRRTDGEYFGEGSAVSPYDYLIEDERIALVEAYKAHTVDKYGRTPRITSYFNAYQPYLTNRLLLHIGNEGNLTGEWLLISSNWEDGYPNDIITIIEAANPWYTGNVILSADYTDMHAEGYKLQGTFDVDYESGRITIFNDNGKLYFGIFEIDESGDRAKLRIQYQAFTYPETFTEDALVYIERSNKIMAVDAFSLGVLAEAPP